MSSESDLNSALTSRAGLTALVSTRIYPDAIPEGDALPVVVYQRASTSRVTTIGSVTAAETVRFLVTVWSDTRAAAEVTADQVEAALAAAGNPIVDRSAGFDAECGLYAVTVDCDWWHVF